LLAETIAGSFGFATIRSPMSGSFAPPRSAAEACASILPSDEPTAAEFESWKPVGT